VRTCGCLLLLSVVVARIPVHAQTPSAAVVVSVANGTARLTFAEFSGLPIDLKPLSVAAVIDSAEILSVQNDNDNEISYIVLRVSGRTVKNGRSGHCGAGYEENLIWMKVSHTVLQDVRSVLYSSCAFSIEPMSDVRLINGHLRVEYYSGSERRTFICTYDAASPRDGFSVVSKKDPPESK
jgi:hypothetical protein